MAEKIDEMYVRKLLSFNLRRLRLEQHLSQTKLFSKTGISSNFISDIEKCKKGISQKSIAKLSNAFKVEPHNFFLPERVINEANIIQDIVNQLPEQQKRVVELKYWHDLSDESIEKQTGLKRGNIKMILSRTRKLIQKQYFIWERK